MTLQQLQLVDIFIWILNMIQKKQTHMLEHIVMEILLTTQVFLAQSEECIFGKTIQTLFLTCNSTAFSLEMEIRTLQFVLAFTIASSVLLECPGLPTTVALLSHALLIHLLQMKCFWLIGIWTQVTHQFNTFLTKVEINEI